MSGQNRRRADRSRSRSRTKKEPRRTQSPQRYAELSDQAAGKAGREPSETRVANANTSAPTGLRLRRAFRLPARNAGLVAPSFSWFRGFRDLRGKGFSLCELCELCVENVGSMAA